MQTKISENRHPGFLSHDRSWYFVPSARLIPEKKTKWRDVLLLGVAVSLFMLLVSLMIRPIGVYQIVKSTLSCLYLRPLTLISPCTIIESCFRFFLLHLLPKKSDFFHSSCIFLVFPFFTLAFESLFLDLSTKLKNYSLS